MTPRILGNRYQLLEQVGSGGMAIVYRALDLRTQHQVAVKLLRPDLAQNEEYVARFQREADAASKMTHHNIVNLLDVGMDGEDRYLVMEYVQGETLKQLIQKRKQIPPDLAVQITIRILSALKHAHENGIVHRDIKPQNILMDQEGLVKVADFGIARIANSQTLTDRNIVMGSVHYFSPEQARGQSADVRSDIYSVGVVLYEMLTGRVPFDGDSHVSIAMQHIHGQPTPIEELAPGTPPAVIQVCMVALSKNPANRYQTALEMAMDLRSAQKEPTNLAPLHPLEAGIRRKTPAGNGTSQDSGPQEPRVTGGQQAQNTDSGRNRKRRRINPLWWMVTLLTTCAVIAALFFGTRAILDSALNNTEVPDLLGSEITAAERAATRAGLKVRTVENNHPTVSAGLVVAQAPEVGTTLKKGDTVLLTVSKGPTSQLVPSLTGMTTQDAISAAKALGLTLTVRERVVSQDVQADFVLSQTPEANTQCQPGDIISVTVSGGVAVVPKTVGEPLSAAQDALTAAGLSVSAAVTFVSTEDTSLHGTVASQTLEPETMVIRGTSVALSVYQVPSLLHAAEVTLNLPESDSLLSVRITVDVTGAEVTCFQQDYTADALRHPVVKLTSQIAGTCRMRVYINGEFKYFEEVTLK